LRDKSASGRATLFPFRGATQGDGRLAIVLTSGSKEMRSSGTLAKLKVE